MNIFNIEALIANKKIIALDDINPTEAYIQVGVFNPGNPRGSNNYPSAVLPLSNLLEGKAPDTGTITYNPFEDGSLLNLNIITGRKPKFVTMFATALYALDADGLPILSPEDEVLYNYLDPVGVHIVSINGISNGPGTDSELVIAPDYSRQYEVNGILGLQTMPFMMYIPHSFLAILGTRLEDRADTGAYCYITSFNDNGFSIEFTKYGYLNMVGQYTWTAYY